jgi:hypothetical protein
MVKRALTSYDTVCWPDRLSFAQEMRESQVYIGVNSSPRSRTPPKALPGYMENVDPLDQLSIYSGEEKGSILFRRSFLVDSFL